MLELARVADVENRVATQTGAQIQEPVLLVMCSKAQEANLRYQGLDHTIAEPHLVAGLGYLVSIHWGNQSIAVLHWEFFCAGICCVQPVVVYWPGTVAEQLF